MLDKLSSVSLALCAMFLLLMVVRASSGDSSLWLTWTVYGLVAAVFGLLTVFLRKRIETEEARKESQSSAEQSQQDFLRDASLQYKMNILNAEPTGKPGRYICEIQVEEDHPSD